MDAQGPASRMFLVFALVLFCLPTWGRAHAQDIYTDLEYICSGERISAKCAYDDKSDAAHCQLTYHDRHRPNGNLTYGSATRGEVRKLFATCTPPSADEIAEQQRYEAGVKQAQDQAVKEQRQYRERMQARGAGGAASDPGTEAMRRCAAAGRDLMQCFGEVMGSSVQQVTGNGMPGVGKNLVAGLRMTGRYSEGQLGLTFNESQVLVACGGGIYNAEYSVVRNGSGDVVLSATPDAPHQRIGIKPFTVLVQPNGVLTGTGVINAVAEHSIGRAAQSVQASRHYLTQLELESSYSYRLNEVHRDEAGNLYVNVQPGTMHTANMVTCNVSTIQPIGSSGNTNASQALSHKDPTVLKAATAAETPAMRFNQQNDPTFTAITMSRFANYLSQMWHEPVVDQTGLTGTYDFSLSPSAIEVLPGQTWGDRVRQAVFIAGFKIEERKVPTDVTVVDRCKRPSEN